MKSVQLRYKRLCLKIAINQPVLYVQLNLY